MAARGFVTMPGVRLLNDWLEQFGFTADVRVIHREAELFFDRSVLRDVHGTGQEDIIKVLRAKISSSLDTVASTLGLPLAAGGEPNIAAIGLSSKPHQIRPQGLVRTTRGPGFLERDNPHPGCLALVTPADLSPGLALLTPFSVEPAVWGVYAGKRLDGSPFVITFTILSIWQQLAENGSDLIRLTFRKLQERVQAEGGVFLPAHVWVFVGPGASQWLKVPRMGLSANERERFVYTEVLPNYTAGRSGEPDEIEVSFLDVRGWVEYILRTLTVAGTSVNGEPLYLGVRVDRAFTLNHNTIGNSRYVRKGPPDEDLRSSALVGVVKPC